MPFDEEGNLVDQTPGSLGEETAGSGVIAPPGYGEHVLDQLYENISVSGFQTPAVPSGLNTPYYSLPQSRAGSIEDMNRPEFLAPPVDGVAAAALSSRLQDVSLDASQRNTSFNSLGSSSAAPSATASGTSTAPSSAPLSRSNSVEERAATTDSSAATSPSASERSLPASGVLVVPAERRPRLPELKLDELNKVPSYSTAVQTPTRQRPLSVVLPPDYLSVTAPNTPAASVRGDPLDEARLRPTTSAERPRPRTTWPRPLSIGSFMMPRLDSYERRRSYLLQTRAY
jgi:arrestin-related trafficking adapter 4/5/7